MTAPVHQPDILEVIADLSNDEVFTPPRVAADVLDLLPEDVWTNPDLRFLDPGVKTGVFLREIVKRLMVGLADEIRDEQERLEHILRNQVYGIAITELTAEMSRRTLYCSKKASGEKSVVKMSTASGNIWYQRVEHTFVGGKCAECPATEAQLDRGEPRETYAYGFIHSSSRQAIGKDFGMEFDVIVGNPPYQLDDGGHGTSAAPIYHQFVQQAKALNPRYVSMIIPSRWFTGGKGLDAFRETMLNDGHVRTLVDYLTASDIFPDIGLKGGVCYFLWDRDNPGDCSVTTYYKDQAPSTASRPLLEEGADVFIRFNQGLSILRKVMLIETGLTGTMSLPTDRRFDLLVSSRKPFGLETKFKGASASKRADDLRVFQNGGEGYVARSKINSGQNLFDEWKVFVGRAAPGTGNKDTYPHRIISTPFVGRPGTISSETYLCIGPFKSKKQAESVRSYLSCRLTRFLILLHKASQDTTRKVYTFVPTQDWTQIWTDEALYEKYGITENEQAYIESIVREMPAP